MNHGVYQLREKHQLGVCFKYTRRNSLFIIVWLLYLLVWVGFHCQFEFAIPLITLYLLFCFRYDARLHFTDKGQFTSKPSDLASSLTPEEEAIEKQCDEERYMDLHRDMSEYEIQQGNCHQYELFVLHLCGWRICSLKRAEKYTHCRHMHYFGPVSCKVAKLIAFIQTAHDVYFVSTY